MLVQQIYLGMLDYFANLEQNKLFYLQILTPPDANRRCPRSNSQRDLMSAFARELYGLAQSMVTAPNSCFTNTLD